MIFSKGVTIDGGIGRFDSKYSQQWEQQQRLPSIVLKYMPNIYPSLFFFPVLTVVSSHTDAIDADAEFESDQCKYCQASN